MLRARAARRSCRLHGDNGCELQGEAGPRTRVQETRQWRREAAHEIDRDTTGPHRGASVMERTGVMPKENVNSDMEGTTRIEVSWQHDAYIQLTTALRREEPATAEHPNHVAYDTGAYVSLDRHGINRLIQILRRARNAVFGKDE